MHSLYPLRIPLDWRRENRIPVAAAIFFNLLLLVSFSELLPRRLTQSFTLRRYRQRILLKFDECVPAEQSRAR